MKRVFSRDLLRNKWVVPIAALTLTLAIGSISFAATDNAGELPIVSSSTTTTTSGTTNTPGPTPTSGTATTSGALTTVTAPPTPILLSPALAGTNAGDIEAQSPEDLAMQQAKESAILNLIRERMTEPDRVAFDQLRTLATQQQLALAKAQTELSDTTAKIRVLVFKYLGITSTTSSSTPSTLSTSSTVSTSPPSTTGSSN